jgi:type IV pilus assembly protein PilB
MDVPTRIQTLNIPELNPFFSAGVIDPIKFINTLFSEAVKIRASDIFFEPTKSHLLVRVKVDGVLYEIGSLTTESYLQVTSRIKIMAELDPSEKRKVQEGKINIDREGSIVNLRVEVANTINGELVVIRIHEKKTIVMPLEELGFSQISYKNYTGMLAQRSGLILVVGPTGCGKTTTLYSTISKINEGAVFNIMTIEDPVEFSLDGVNQMQVHKESGFTFAQGLKTILRLSPDIVFVGEIRDKETADIAVESGLTGQLVLSTMHSEDSVGALFRLLDLGIETYLLNSSLMGIVAQRLIRKICSSCKESKTISKDESDLFQKAVGRSPKQLFTSKGCEYCESIGFKGRMGIYEVLLIDSKIRELVRNHVSETDLRNNLIREGYETLLRDGLLKAEQGLTTAEEVLRNSLRIS